MDEIKLIIDGIEVRVKDGTTILQAAHSMGIYIPTLCYHPSLPSDDTCQLCLVEVEGREDFPLSCITPVEEGVVVYTDTPQIRAQQREVLKQILAYHPCGCLTCWRRERCRPFDICLRNVAVTERCVLCPKNEDCELQKVVDYFDFEEDEFPYSYRNLPVYKDNPFFDRDYNLCIGCGRCVRVCRDVRGIEAIALVDYDDQRIPQPSDGKSLIDSGCKLCCVCVEVCPTGALMDREAKWEPGLERQVITNPCSYACPAGIDIPLYVGLISEGRFAESLAVIREKVPFPGVLGRVCVHPCETACRRNKLNDPISIKFLKRFVADSDTGEWKQFSRMLPPTGKKVAIVGSGPAGLTAAYYLAKSGHSVTVFEQFSKPGGMMRVGIPDYRLPPEILDAEIEEIKQAGVDIKVNTKIESIDMLFEQGYNAVFLALGAHRGTSLRVEGEDIPGVVDGATFLRDVNLGQKVDVGDKVAVIGGGNVAIDSARTALRLGTEEVTIVYRRTRAEMPASPEEVEAAIEEGVNVVFLAAPIKISKEGSRLTLTCNRMVLGEPDASGRRRPVPIKGSEFSMDFDSIIAAIGQAPDIPSQFGLEVGRGNTLQVDPDTLATDRQGVYAGGDVVIGPASVIEAIAAGRRAAISIDKYLGGSGEIDEVLTTIRQFDPCVGKDTDFLDRVQVQMPCISEEERVGNFAEVELGFDEQAAVAEAKRCLQCAFRRQILPVPLPPVRAKRTLEEAKTSV